MYEAKVNMAFLISYLNIQLCYFNLSRRQLNVIFMYGHTTQSTRELALQKSSFIGWHRSTDSTILFPKSQRLIQRERPQKWPLKCNFLQYYSILSSIPQNWKKLLQESSKDPDIPPTSICSLSCKAIYSILLNLEDLPPPTSEKKLLASGVEKSDLNKVYLLPCKAKKEIKIGNVSIQNHSPNFTNE